MMMHDARRRLARASLLSALTPIALLASSPAKADPSTPLLSADGEQLVWDANCALDSHPGSMHCLSRHLVPKSFAEERAKRRAARGLTAAPDAGAGVDASVDISSCDGVATGGGGGGGTPRGLAPADFVKAYEIPTAGKGAGKIIAIVDACAETTVVADLAKYRAQYSLPALPECGGKDGVAPTPGGAACFGVVSQRGGGDLPPGDSGWAMEIALDVDMASAACPECSIVLVEADSPNSWDLGPAVSEAVTLGAAAVSNSWGANEDPDDQFGVNYSDGPYTSYFDHPGVLIAVASGDDLYNNQTLAPTPGIPSTLAPSFPATLPSVLSVGGTSLTSGSGSTRGGFTEAIWNQGGGGTTSGCSSEFAKPSFQSGVATGSCAMRADVDVAAIAEDVSTYVGGRWQPESGTSCASPFVTALMVHVGLASATNAFLYQNAAAFFDITTGNNDPSGACTDVMCNAGAGWDGVTGLGSPNATLLAALGGDSPPVVDGGGTDGATDASTGDSGSSGDGGGKATEDSGAGGTGGTGGGNGASNSSGCGCTSVRADEGGPGALAALGALALAFGRRRRR